MLNALFLLAALAAPQEKVFDDWAVACDNVKRCEATALQAPEQFGDEPAQVLISREPGPAGALAISIDPGEGKRGAITLLIDGKPVVEGVVTDNYRISGAPAEQLARRMAAGHWLELRQGGKVAARVSLAGISAMLRHVDATQGRAGTVTAIVATGTAAAVTVPVAASLPVVPALRTARGAPESPSKAVLGELARLGDCDLSLVSGDLPVERYRLDAKATLVLLPCGSGAYNFNTAAFVLRGGAGVPAEFDVPPDWIEGDGPAILTNSGFSTVDGAMLTSSAKGRGLGDCGTSQSWVWDGSRFRLIEARTLGECRGSVSWLTVFRAMPAWR
ncbi:MAG: DUF1176 domain-containing protein [Sphingomonadales bacterium]|nr:MAG: DUF1176 domain-containing protein [Sphingomonadales bacterium]